MATLTPPGRPNHLTWSGLDHGPCTHQSAWSHPLKVWLTGALARDGVSREVPCSALKGETVPDSSWAGYGWRSSFLFTWSTKVGASQLRKVKAGAAVAEALALGPAKGQLLLADN